MAYINSKTGCFASGTVGRDAEYKEVGDKQTPHLKFSIAVGKDSSGNATWFNCQAWRKLAEYGNKLGIVKGDIVTVFGKWESNDYNGQTYHNLIVEWIHKLGETITAERPVNDSFNVISEDVDDGDLPF